MRVVPEQCEDAARLRKRALGLWLQALLLGVREHRLHQLDDRLLAHLLVTPDGVRLAPRHKVGGPTRKDGAQEHSPCCRRRLWLPQEVTHRLDRAEHVHEQGRHRRVLGAAGSG
eukprot:5255626-Prymnesium_polylepis.1